MVDGRQPSVEDDLWRKTTFGGRWPLMHDDLWCKTTFGGRLPLVEDNLWWKTTLGGRRPWVEDTLWWKMTFGGRQSLHAAYSALQHYSWHYDIFSNSIQNWTTLVKEVVSYIIVECRFWQNKCFFWPNYSKTFTFSETKLDNIREGSFFDQLHNLDCDKMTAFWPKYSLTFAFYWVVTSS